MPRMQSNRNVGNNNYTRVEPLITVKKLKERYLFGVSIVDHEGNEISDAALQNFIDTAVSTIEHDLDITVKPTRILEYKDYFANDYWDWGYLQLNRIPVISVDRMRVVYLKEDEQEPEDCTCSPEAEAASNNSTVLEIPKNWIRLDPESGIIRMVPNNKFPARLQVDASGAFFPELFRRYSTVPNMWEIIYTHGFKDGQVPVALNTAIGLLAANYALIIAGDLILGSAGIAGTSISLDNMSQSIQTTASAENNGFSARIKDNNRQLFGDKTLGTSGIIEILRSFYKGQAINII